MNCSNSITETPTPEPPPLPLYIQLGLKRNLLDDRSYFIATGTEKASNNPFLGEKKIKMETDTFLTS